MRRVALIVLLSIPAAMAADKDKGHFVPGPASSYPGHQTQEKITIAAIPYITAEQAATAFGKVKPYEHGILPVLVIIENGSGKALRLDLAVQFVDPANHHLEAIPPEDVVTYQAIRKPPRPRDPRRRCRFRCRSPEEGSAEYARDREPGALGEIDSAR